MNPQHWLAAEMLVDVKVNEAWEIGRILLIENSTLTISIQGKHISLSASSKLLAPFRRYSSISSLYAFPQDFSRSRLKSTESTLKFNIDQGLDHWSAIEITQFYRGELFLMLSSLISNNFVEISPFSTSVIQFLVHVLQAISKCFAEYSLVFIEYYKTIYNPELVLTDKIAAFVNTWPEIVEIFKNLLGNNSVWQEFYMKLSHEKEVLALHKDGAVLENGFSYVQMLMIETFGSFHGFDRLFAMICNEEVASDIPIEFLASLDFSFIIGILKTELADPLLPDICSYIIQRVASPVELEMISVDLSKVSKLLEDIATAELGISRSTALTTYLKFLMKAVKSRYLEKRVKGIKELSAIIEQNERVMTDSQIAELLSEENFVEAVLEQGLHIEVIKRASVIFQILAKCNHINLTICQALWQAIENSMNTLSVAILMIVNDILPWIQRDLISFFYQKITEMPENLLDIEVLYQFIVKIMKTRYDVSITHQSLECVLINSEDCKVIEDVAEKIAKILAIPEAVAQAKEYLARFEKHLISPNKSFQHILLATKLFPLLSADILVPFFRSTDLIASVIKNLTFYKNSLPESTKISRGEIILHFPHGTHILHRLMLIEFIINYKEFPQILQRKLLKLLWVNLAIQCHSSKEKTLFYTSISKGIRYGPLTKDYSRVLKIFLNFKYFDLTGVCVKSYKAFKHFFLLANSPESITLNSENKFHCVSGMVINGLKEMIRLALIADDSIKTRVFNLLRRIFTVISSELYNLADEIFQNSIVLLINEYQCVSESNNFIDFLYALADVEPKSAHKKEFRIHADGKVWACELPLSSTALYLRNSISRSFNFEYLPILMINNEIFTHINSHKVVTLDEASEISIFSAQQSILELSPIKLISGNTSILSLLYYQVLNKTQSQHYAWTLFCHLSLPESIKHSIIDLKFSPEIIHPSKPEIFLLAVIFIRKISLNEAWLHKFVEGRHFKYFCGCYAELKRQICIPVKLEEVFLQFFSKVLKIPTKNNDSFIPSILSAYFTLLECSLEVEKPDILINSLYQIFTYMIEEFNEEFYKISKDFMQNYSQKMMKLLLSVKDPLAEPFIIIFGHICKHSNFGNEILALHIKDELTLQDPETKNNYLFFTKTITDLCDIKDEIKLELTNQLISLIHELKEVSSSDLNHPLYMILVILEKLSQKTLIEVDIVKMAEELVISTEFPQRCKTYPTRSSAFMFLHSLCVKSEEYLNKLIDALNKNHNDLSWRRNRSRDWSIPLESQAKSPLGYVGLKNSGCICYANAFLQQLYFIESFRSAVIHLNTKEAPLCFEIQKLFKKLKHSNSKAVSALALLKTLYSGRDFHINEQKDSDEFLAQLIEKVNSELAESDESLLDYHFGGDQELEIVSKQCKHTNIKKEYFRSISLEVRNNKNLYQSLERLTSSEVLDYENAISCSKCSEKGPAVTRIRLSSLPNFLIFTLRRFEYDIDQKERVKINDLFEFPEEINMEKYCVKRFSGEGKIGPEYYQYSLKGILVHVGKADHGHYFSYVFMDDKRWVLFNDSEVSAADFNMVKNCSFGGEMNKPSAYILIYERLKKFEFCGIAQKLPTLYNESVDIREILEKNNQKLKKLTVFRYEYLEFHMRVMKTFPSYDIFLLQFFLTILSRAQGCELMKVEMLDYLVNNLGVEGICFLLEILSSKNGCKEFLLYNPDPVSKRMLVLIVKLKSFELNQMILMNYFYGFVSMAAYLDEKHVNCFSHYLEILSFFCRNFNEEVEKRNIISELAKAIIKYEHKLPSWGIEQCSHIGYEEYYYREEKSNESKNLCRSAAIDLIADTLYLLDEPTMRFIRSHEGINAFICLKGSWRIENSISKMYSNIFSTDLNGANEYINLLFSRFLETNDRFYLIMISKFVNQYSERMQILPGFLEIYLSMIPCETFDITLDLLKQLLKMLKRVKFSEVKEWITNEKVEIILNWIRDTHDVKKKRSQHFLKRFERFLSEDTQSDSDCDMCDSNLDSGSDIEVYDYSQEKYFSGRIIWNFNREMILVKYVIDQREVLCFKDNYSFDDINLLS